MSQTITAIDLIRRSMYLINAVSAGEIPDDVDLNDALLTLNEMLDSWNLQPLAVYASPTESFQVTPGKAVYTWGPAGDITTPRPIKIESVTCVRLGVSTPVEVISQEQYDAVSIKTIGEPVIERVLYINDYPKGILTCFPVPTEAITLTFATTRQIQGPITLQSTVALPPGYLRAIRYGLAVELWPEYTNTSTDIASIKDIAARALGHIKVANILDTPSSFEDFPGVEIGRSWDWRQG